jgi:hypothetical protein
MYAMTGLYSETQADDSSADIPHDTETDSLPSATINATTTVHHHHSQDTVIKCHSRQPSSGLVDR